ncbi:MAG: ABC transporter permease [Phototrophicaceae bacterium]|jgi:rhamnose transport system permease protein
MTTQAPSQANLIPQPSLIQRARVLILSREGILFIIMLVAVALLSSQNDNFFTSSNLLNQLRLLTEVGLVALPMTYIIITGGIDLSVGSIFGLAAIVLGYTWQTLGFPLPLAIVTALVVGMLSGFINGYFITRVKVPPLIMTLATLAFYRGLAEGISRGRSATGYPEWFYVFGQGDFWGIPTQIWLLLISVVLAGIVLARTTFGRTLYAIGNNETGARFSGLPVSRYVLLIYTFSGFMSALAGALFVSRVSTTRSDMGSGLELDVIAAVVLGGTSIFGGTGSITGTIIGMVLIQLLKNGLALSGVTSDATIIIIGLVVVFSILINNWVQGRQQS